jgi:hypothetical protein
MEPKGCKVSAYSLFLGDLIGLVILEAGGAGPPHANRRVTSMRSVRLYHPGGLAAERTRRLQ